MPGLREALTGLLREKNFSEALDLMRPRRGSIRALMGLLYHDEEIVRWRAVSMFGRLAQAEPELVRPAIKRLLWFMSEESSTVGWGSAQTIGEIARVNPELGLDAARVVVHYLDDEELRLPANRNTYMLAGSIWAIGSLAKVQPGLATEMGPGLTELLADPDPQVRGVSAWALGEMAYAPAAHALEGLLRDEAAAVLYEDEELKLDTVGGIAKVSLGKIRPV